MLTVSVLAVTRLKDGCLLIVAILDINPSGPFTFPLYFLSDPSFLCSTHRQFMCWHSVCFPLPGVSLSTVIFSDQSEFLMF